MEHRAPPVRAQRGFSLVEVLVAVVVFALGVLGLVRLQATAVKMSTDARQRAEATFLVDQLLARMLIADRTKAAEFNHRPVVGSTCAPSGASSDNALVKDWLAQVQATFPRASASAQQVIVSGANADIVTVRLCWKNGEADATHSMEVVNRVQWP
jgi:type IV pilus assembly protein PilV